MQFITADLVRKNSHGFSIGRRILNRFLVRVFGVVSGCMDFFEFVFMFAVVVQIGFGKLENKILVM